MHDRGGPHGGSYGFVFLGRADHDLGDRAVCLGPGGGDVRGPRGARVAGEGGEEALAHGREVGAERTELAVVTSEVSAEANEARRVVDQVHDAQQRAQQAAALGVHAWREHRTDLGVPGEEDRVEAHRHLRGKRLDHGDRGAYEADLADRQRWFDARWLGGPRLIGVGGHSGRRLRCRVRRRRERGRVARATDPESQWTSAPPSVVRDGFPPADRGAAAVTRALEVADMKSSRWHGNVQTDQAAPDAT